MHGRLDIEDGRRRDESRRPSIGFGLERLGLPAIRHPVIALLLIGIFTVACGVGITRLKVEQTLSELFRGSAPEYADYKRLSDRFPTSEFDVMVVVEGEDLMRPEPLEAVRKLHRELESVAAVDGVISLFSMRDPPDAQGAPQPTLPDELPDGEAFEAAS